MAERLDRSSTKKVAQGLDIVRRPDFSVPVARQFRLIDARDLSNTVIFMVLFVVAGLNSRRAWLKVSHLFASLHMMIRRSPTDRFRGAALALESSVEPVDLERSQLAGVYNELIYTMREHLPGGWRPNIDLQGGEHLAQALRVGRGVVLWISPSAGGELVRAKALSEAGFDPVILSHSTHPYSGTAYGRRVLNPIRTRIEDRYLRGKVIFADGEEATAIRELQDHLRENSVIAILAIGAADNPIEVPFLGGTLRLALGAPFLAALEGAPLLPVFVVPKANGAFEVHVGSPLQSEVLDGEKPTPEQLAVGFAKRLETYIRRHPMAWRGWSYENLWSPNQTEHEVTHP